jgi:glycerol-3-phosphate acyltransferase PlsY
MTALVTTIVAYAIGCISTGYYVVRLAVGIAQVAAGSGAAGAALVAVVGGHIAPPQLGFRGGRGLGPALGGMLVLDWRVALAGLVVAAVCAAAARALTVAGLAGAVAAPVAALALGERETAVAAGVTAAIVAAAHARGQLQG